MNKICIPIIMIVIFSCVGCDKGHHVAFKKNGDVLIGDSREVLNILSRGTLVPDGPLDLLKKMVYPSSNYMLTSIEGMTKAIIIPYTYKGSSFAPYTARANMILCAESPPSGGDMGDSMMVTITTNDEDSRKAVALTTPSELKKYDLLDDNNLSKGDICIYPADNLSFGNLKESDMFSISKEEMDSAIIEFENE